MMLVKCHCSVWYTAGPELMEASNTHPSIYSFTHSFIHPAHFDIYYVPGCVPGIRARRIKPPVASNSSRSSGETDTSSVGGTSAGSSGNGGGTSSKGNQRRPPGRGDA